MRTFFVATILSAVSLGAPQARAENDWTNARAAAGLIKTANDMKAARRNPEVSALPLPDGIKLSLTVPENAKFQELARYALSKERPIHSGWLVDQKIERGWLADHNVFEVEGRFKDDGSFALDDYILNRGNLKGGYLFWIKADGTLDGVMQYGLVHSGQRNRAEDDVQAALSDGIDYWMKAEIPADVR